ncbi:MAG: Iron-sulfur cluster assembly scaffold protein IscU [Nitrospira sp.]|nr:Iron-sulfur cluster assembly scaffold protein IscU [Nitrospira sp.]
MQGRTDIVQELNLPPVKIHCSVLAEDAIKAALDDFQRKRSATQTQPTERVCSRIPRRCRKTLDRYCHA